MTARQLAARGLPLTLHTPQLPQRNRLGVDRLNIKRNTEVRAGNLEARRQTKNLRVHGRGRAALQGESANLLATVGAATTAASLEGTRLGAAVGGTLLAFTLRAVLAEACPLLRASTWGGGPVDSFLPVALVLTIIASRSMSGQERLSKDAGCALLRVLVAFLFGTVGSILGSASAFGLHRWLGISPAEAAKAAGCLAATYVGGCINFVSTARTVGLEAAAFGALSAADILLMGAYFAVLAALYRSGSAAQKSTVSVSIDERSDQNLGVARAAAIAAALVALSTTLAQPLHRLLSWLPGAETLAVTLSSWMVASLASKRPDIAKPVAEVSGKAAAWFMLAFFASIGAEARVRALTNSLGLTLLAAVVLCVHGAVLTFSVLLWNAATPRRWQISLPEALVASNANIGGPATAAACAGITFRRVDLVFPATVAGITGYGVATTLGVLLSQALS